MLKIWFLFSHLRVFNLFCCFVIQNLRKKKLSDLFSVRFAEKILVDFGLLCKKVEQFHNYSKRKVTLVYVLIWAKVKFNFDEQKN